MRIQLLVLANSRKSGGRCLAGVRTDTLEWIRPITLKDHNELPSSDCIDSKSDKPLRPLDIIEIELIRAMPFKHQRENWLCEPSSITMKEKGSLTEVLPKIEKLTGKSPWFMTEKAPKIDPGEYNKLNANASSLALVEVANAEIFKNKWGSRRIKFEYETFKWELPFTDDYFDESQGHIQRALLCLSVGEEWRRVYGPSNQSWHYKLVAGLIAIPKEQVATEATSNNDSLIEICKESFNLTPKVSEDRGQLQRFSISGWFYQESVSLKCQFCQNSGLLIFRKHFRRYARDMHYWGIVCAKCKIGCDSKTLDRKFVSQLDDAIESRRPVKKCCEVCLSK